MSKREYDEAYRHRPENIAKKKSYDREYRNREDVRAIRRVQNLAWQRANR